MSQDRRLHRLARDLLTRYDVEVRACRLAARSWNTVFRVDATDGSRYALRVSPAARTHTFAAEQVEAQWMGELAAAGVAVPHVLTTRTGSVVATATRPDVPGERTAVLFEWVAGGPLGRRLTPNRVAATGRLSAQLHEHARGRGGNRPPILVADRAIYFPVPDRLAALPHGDVFTAARDRTQTVFDSLWGQPPHPPMLLHGDLNPNNVMVSGRSVVAIDFQDVTWGFDVQDLAITTAALRREPGGGELVEALRGGYETVREWPRVSAHVMHGLEAARNLQLLNMTANFRYRDGAPPEYIERHLAMARRWLAACT